VHFRKVHEIVLTVAQGTKDDTLGYMNSNDGFENSPLPDMPPLLASVAIQNNMVIIAINNTPDQRSLWP
jgi:hypothetical protein